MLGLKKRGIKNPIYVHETATIDSGAQIGSGTKIWHWTHVMDTAVIGESCIIGQGCFIAGQIGDWCKIQNSVNLFKGVVLEDEVFVGPGVTFTNVKRPRANIEQKNKFLFTIIKKGATIGAGSIIVCGITIGEAAFIGAGSVVTKSVPAGKTWCGNPAKRLIYIAYDCKHCVPVGMPCGESAFYCFVRMYGRFDCKCEDYEKI